MLFVIKMTIHGMFVRKRNYFMSFALICIGGMFILSALYEFFYAEYRVNEINKLISDKSVIHVSIIPEPVAGPDYYKGFSLFEKTVSKMYGNDYGKFFYVDAFSPNKNTLYDNTVMTLYLDRSCLEFCSSGKCIEDMLISGQDTVLVGYELSKTIPVGKVIFNNFTGKAYTVAGVLPKGTKWIGSNPFVAEDPAESLDDHVVSLMDNDLFEWQDGALYGACFHSMYLDAGEREYKDIREKLFELAGDKNIKIGAVRTIEEEIHKEYSERADWIRAGGNLTLFAIFLCFAACIAVGLSDALNMRKETGIMRICGVSNAAIRGIVVAGNTFCIMPAGVLAYMINGHVNRTGNGVVMSDYVFPAYIVILILLIITVSFFTSHLLVKKQEIKMINEVYV